MNSPGDDPRLSLPPEEAALPAVALPGRGMPGWLIAAVFGMAAIGLFLILEARREGLNAQHSVRPAAAGPGTFETAPPLALPPPPPPPAPVIVERVVTKALPSPAPSAQPAFRPMGQPLLPPLPPLPPPPRAATGGSEPALVVDLSPADAAAASAAGTAGDDTAIRATIIRNRGSLVPQGTLIAATLETPIDSDKPGLARAVVARDARSFDGTRVLIPRGSRLIGEYRADTAPGQRRVLVTWTRLIRPDGVAIRIGSPGADTLGGTGLAGRVNTHFFERFTNAVLQSALTVGVNLASQPRSGGVYVGIPSQAANLGQTLFPNVNPTTTIKVRQGAEIAIFVARDLDFGGLVPRE